MDHQQNTGHGGLNLILSITCSILAWISLKDAQVIFGMVASSVAIISGIAAARYYIILANEKRQKK